MTTSYTLSGSFRDIVGSEARGLMAFVDTNLGADALVDYDNNLVRLPGLARIPVNDDGTFSISLIATNSSGTNVPNGDLRWIVYAAWKGPEEAHRWSSGFFELTSSLNLSDAVPTAGTPPTTGGGGGGGTNLRGYTTELTDPTNDRLAWVSIRHDGSTTSDWPNRWQWEWVEQNGAKHLVNWVNEYGEQRHTPARPSTVGWRLFLKDLPSDPTRTTPAWQVVDDRTNRTPVVEIDEKGLRAVNLPSAVVQLEPGDPVPTGTPEGAVIMRRGATRVLVLNVDAPVPEGTPPGTLIVRHA